MSAASELVIGAPARAVTGSRRLSFNRLSAELSPATPAADDLLTGPPGAARNPGELVSRVTNTLPVLGSRIDSPISAPVPPRYVDAIKLRPEGSMPVINASLDPPRKVVWS